jgi:integrase
LLWRVVLAVSTYCYARDGELRVLTCGDIDLEHNEIRITKAWDRRKNEIGSPKGGKAREIAIEPTLAPLLEALKAGRPDDALLFPKFPSERDMARGLRRWLTRADVKRNELHNKTPTTRPIRFHDMRSTGILWRAVREDPKFEIQYHAGHLRFSTTEGYFEIGKAKQRGFGAVFPALPSDLIEAARALPSAGVLDHKLDHAAE